MATVTKSLRQHLVRLLSWSDAHISFDDAVAGLPAALRGKVPDGLPYSAWQLVEQLRLTQADILEFCVSREYKEKAWRRITGLPPRRRQQGRPGGPASRDSGLTGARSSG
jgi:hypothetical protein